MTAAQLAVRATQVAGLWRLLDICKGSTPRDTNLADVAILADVLTEEVRQAMEGSYVEAAGMGCKVTPEQRAEDAATPGKMIVEVERESRKRKTRKK